MALKELNLKSPSDITVDYQVRDDPESRRAGEAMQSILAKNLGINVNVAPVDNKRIWASMNEGTFDLSWSGLHLTKDRAGVVTQLALGDGSHDRDAS